MQKELDSLNKSKGKSVVRASTTDEDFDAMIKKQLDKLKNNR